MVKVLMSVGLATGLLVIAQSASAQRPGNGKDGQSSVQAELEKLKAQVKELEARLKEKESGKGEEGKRKFDFKKFDFKKFGEGKEGFDREKMKEMMKKFAEARGKGGFDREKAMEMWKKFAEARGKGGAERGKDMKKFGGRSSFGRGKGGPPWARGGEGKKPGEDRKPGEGRRGGDGGKGGEGRKGDRIPTKGGSELSRVLDRLEQNISELRKVLEKR